MDATGGIGVDLVAVDGNVGTSGPEVLTKGSDNNGEWVKVDGKNGGRDEDGVFHNYDMTVVPDELYFVTVCKIQFDSVRPQFSIKLR